MERTVARFSGDCVIAQNAGTIEKVDSGKIVVRKPGTRYIISSNRTEIGRPLFKIKSIKRSDPKSDTITVNDTVTISVVITSCRNMYLPIAFISKVALFLSPLFTDH